MSRSHRKKSAKGKLAEDEPSGLSLIPEEVPLPHEEVELSEQSQEPKGKNPLAEEIEITHVEAPEFCEYKPEVTFDLPRFRDKLPSHEHVKEAEEELQEEPKEEPTEEPKDEPKEELKFDTRAIPQLGEPFRVPSQVIQTVYDKGYYQGANQGAALYALGLGILQIGVGLAILFL